MLYLLLHMPQIRSDELRRSEERRNVQTAVTGMGVALRLGAAGVGRITGMRVVLLVQAGGIARMRDVDGIDGAFDAGRQ